MVIFKYLYKRNYFSLVPEGERYRELDLGSECFNKRYPRQGSQIPLLQPSLTLIKSPWEAQVYLWLLAALTLGLAHVVLARQLSHPTGQDPWSNFTQRSWLTIGRKEEDLHT